MQLVELARHNDVVLVESYDPLERELPAGGSYRVTDGEASLRVDASRSVQRDRYRERFERQQARIERICGELGLHWIRISTADDMLAELKAGLGMMR